MVIKCRAKCYCTDPRDNPATANVEHIKKNTSVISVIDTLWYYLAKISKEEALRLTKEVRKLIYLGIPEDKIIKDLKISRVTFFRYKKRIKEEIIKTYEKESKDATQYEYAMLKNALEDCYRINYQIANDNKKSPRARSIASEMFVVARAQLVKLAEKGPTFKPQLTM